jgi:hypothetical protein
MENITPQKEISPASRKATLYKQIAAFFSNGPSSVTGVSERFTITGDKAKLYGRA